MTDPEFADATYVEPITHRDAGEGHRHPAARDAVLPTLGARPPLNAAVAPARPRAYCTSTDGRADRRQHSTRSGPARDRERFQGDRHRALAPRSPASQICHDPGRMHRRHADSRLPDRGQGPSFTLGGLGSGIAKKTEADLRRIAGTGLDASPTHEVLLEEEHPRLEGVRARADARPGRQRGRGLLDRETSTRWACTPATRSRSPRPMTLTDRRSTRRDARHRHRDSCAPSGVDTRRAATSSSAVRSRAPARDGRHRDEPRASRAQQRPRLQGHRLPDRPRSRPRARPGGTTLDEIPERHHRPDPGQLSRPALDYVVVKGAEVRVSEEVPRRRHRAHHAHEERRRGQWPFGPELPRGPGQKALRSMESNHGPFGFKNPPRGTPQGLLRDCRTPARRPAGHHPPGRCGPAPASTTSAGANRHRPLVSSEQIHHIDQVAEQGIKQAQALGRERRLTSAKQNAFSDAQIAELRGTTEDRHPRDPLGPSGYGRCTTRWTPAPPSFAAAHRRTSNSTYDDEDRGAAGQHAQGDHPSAAGRTGIGPGHRVRLRLRARVVRASPTRAYETVMVNCKPRRPCPPTTTPRGRL